MAYTITHILITTNLHIHPGLLSWTPDLMSNCQLDSSTWMSCRLLCKNGHITAFLHLRPASLPALLILLRVSGNNTVSYFILLNKHPTIFPNIALLLRPSLSSNFYLCNVYIAFIVYIKFCHSIYVFVIFICFCDYSNNIVSLLDYKFLSNRSSIFFSHHLIPHTNISAWHIVGIQ